MGFLDNSGDIILDAVLTDYGRQLLARGDGSFKITQFALGDDEINYSLYDKTNTGGTAYYDLNILQTPVLEAFTNNAASLNSKLLTIPRTDLLYLPVIKLQSNFFNGTTGDLQNSFVVLTDSTTETLGINGSVTDFASNKTGLIYGFGIGNSDSVELIQGLDTTNIPPGAIIDPDLKETNYIVEMDNRFGTIIKAGANKASDVVEAAKSFIDDDNIASYYFSLGDDDGFVSDVTANDSALNTIIAGPKGTKLQFSIRVSNDLASSQSLFNTLGQSITISGLSFKIIKSVVNIIGATTGYSISVPVIFVKRM